MNQTNNIDSQDRRSASGGKNPPNHLESQEPSCDHQEQAYSWHRLPSGPHKGKSWPQIAFEDPQYVRNASKRNPSKSPLLAEQLMVVADSMQRIKIPQDEKGQMVAEYHYDRAGDCHGMCFLRTDDLPRWWDDPYERVPWIDLQAAAKMKRCSKQVRADLLRTVKRLLKPQTISWTREECEEFFSNLDNFESY